MILTNKHNLPESFILAIKAHDEEYAAGRGETDISATQLIKHPLVVQILKQKGDELVEDVSDRIFSLFGSIGHKILEQGAEGSAVVEERLFMEVNGWKVSAQGDHLNKDGVLSDYKFCKVFKVQKGDIEDWENQLNVLAYLYRKHGYEVKKLQIVAILRDWSKKEAIERRERQDMSFPEANAKVVNIPVWTDEEALEYIETRVRLHQLYDEKPLEEIPECSQKERWQRPSIFAVMKEGRKNAMGGGLQDSKANAVLKMQEFSEKDPKGKYYIEERPSISIKCKYYCHPAVCPYRKETDDD